MRHVLLLAPILLSAIPSIAEDRPTPPITPLRFEARREVLERHRTRLHAHVAACRGEAEATSRRPCQAALQEALMLMWTDWTVSEVLAGTTSDEGLLVYCESAPASCLPRFFGEGGLVFEETFEVLWLSPRSDGRYRRVRLVPDLLVSVPEGPTAYTLVDDETVEDPLLSELIGLSDGNPARGFLNHRAPDAVVHPLASRTSPTADTFTWERPLSKPAYAVCADRVARFGPDDLIGMTVQEGMLTEAIFPAWHYRLPCAAHAVLGGDVPGIVVGKRRPDPRPSDPEDLGGGRQRVRMGALTLEAEPYLPVIGMWAECRITAGSQELMTSPGRHCVVHWVGDVNNDDIDDAILTYVGEMGCSSTALYRSHPGGRIAVGDTWNDC